MSMRYYIRWKRQGCRSVWLRKFRPSVWVTNPEKAVAFSEAVSVRLVRLHTSLGKDCDMCSSPFIEDTTPSKLTKAGEPP